MLNIFNKKEPKANLLVVDCNTEMKAYYEEHKSELDEFEVSLQPLRDEQNKAKFIIKQIYAQHGIDSSDSWFIHDYYLDDETFTDLCVFNEAELASLRKWTQRYKKLETEIIDLFKKYRHVEIVKTR